MNGYWDRVRFLAQVVNPINLLASEEDIEKAKRNGKDERSKILLAARIHPDTGKAIYRPLSLPFVIPANAIIVAGLLYPSQRPIGIAMWQTVNQTMNTGFNWANANKSGGGDMTGRQFIASYAMSVLSSCGIALGINHVSMKRNSASLKAISPLVAVCGANIFNVAVMRGRELADGIAICSENGEVMGTSKNAAKKAIVHTIASRNIVAIALLSAPPIIMHFVRKIAFVRSNPLLLYAANGAAIIGIMVPAIPMGIAAYPQRETIHMHELEYSLQSALGSKQQTGPLFFNRGI